MTNDKSLLGPITRIVLMLLLIAAATTGLYTLKHLPINSNMDILLASDARSMKSFESMKKSFDDRPLCGIVFQHNNLFTNEGRDHLKALCDDLEAMPEIHDSKSLTHSNRPYRKKGVIMPTKMIGFSPFLTDGKKSDKEWIAIKTFTTQYPLAQNCFVSSDGLWGNVLIDLSQGLKSDEEKSGFLKKLHQTIDPHRKNFGTIKTVGFPLLESEVASGLKKQIWFFSLAFLSFALLIITITFRNIDIILLLSLLTGISAVLVNVIWWALQIKISMYTFMALPICLLLQLTLLIHFFSAAPTKGKLSTYLRIAFTRSWRPAVCAWLTTVVALLSLQICETGLIKECSWIAQVGLSGLFLLTYGSLAIYCKLSKPDNTNDELADVQSNWKTLKPKTLGILLTLFTILIGIGLTKLRSDVRASEYLPTGLESGQALNLIDTKLGGLNVSQFQLISNKEKGLFQLPALQFMEQIRKEALKDERVGNVYSFSQIICLLQQLMNFDKQDQLTLPSSPVQLMIYQGILSVKKLPMQDMLINNSFNSGTIIVRTRDMPAKEFLALNNKLYTYAQSICPPNITLQLGPGTQDVLNADRAILKDQVSSFVLGIILVTLLWFILLRKLSYTAYGVICNAIPVLLTLSLMGIFDIPLNTITIMVAVLTFGVGVDDGIFLLSRFTRLVKSGESVTASIDKTWSQKWRPITSTTAILIGGFGLLYWSIFPPLSQFGLLTSISLLMTWFNNTFVLPSLLRHFTRK